MKHLIIIFVSLLCWGCFEDCESGEAYCEGSVLMVCDDRDKTWFSVRDCEDSQTSCIETDSTADCGVE